MGGLFVAAGMLIRHAGSDDLNKIAGAHRRAPVLGWTTLTLLLALAGCRPWRGSSPRRCSCARAWRPGRGG
jgi:formate hydrogenlyase subunit 3/multisubunit Na+/H+ antiporter MnhD subunit